MPSYEGITAITIRFAYYATKIILNKGNHIAAEHLRLPGEIYSTQAVPERIKK